MTAILDDVQQNLRHRLMMRRIHVHLVDADDIVKPRSLGDGDAMTRLVSGIWLLVRQSILHAVRDMLDQGSAERDVQQLLSTADAEKRHVARDGASGDP